MSDPIPLKYIKTSRTLIRPVKIQDASSMHAAMKTSFENLKAWMPWAQQLASLRDTEVYLAHGERLWTKPPQDGAEQPLQIMDPSDTFYLGATGIKPANLSIPSFEIGYWVNDIYAGQGLITEAMNALTRFLFDVMRAKRVEINCEEDNEKSAKVAKRLNYDLEGILRNQRLNASSTAISNSLIFSAIDVNQLPPMKYEYR